ncbi:MAG: UDP-N-acetylmuramoyl-L-alanyl-D-glutamate--2,6-diaminopimelate ligase [Bacteriovoracaceae bacterium]|nr:UDP-N-acetylmuramoyl-L-alanyl-D-glutamate--2,6-diaminopimelate ligase [Bacteriovoracaceae bacterium]
MKNDYTKYILIGEPTLIDGCLSLDWRIEQSSNQKIIVYQLGLNSEAQKKLQTQLQIHQPGLLVLNNKPTFEVNCPYLVIRNEFWMAFQEMLCDQFFPKNEKIKFVGITGTNGKTTTADLALQILRQLNIEAISIGTLGVRKNNLTIEEIGLTTPGYIQLRKIIFDHGNKCDVIVMEASSHALQQERLFNINYSVAAWTSFTQDHLDYHKTMDEYFRSKELILSHLGKDGKLYVPSEQNEILKKLSKYKNVFPADDIKEEIKKRLPPFFKSKFNLENLACSLAIIKELGFSDQLIRFEELLPPPGRFFIKEWNKRKAIVDFAHTPDALENIIKAIKESFPNDKLKVLFGCGGDRDKTKRPLMGEVASRFADELIITSDNPRTEDPSLIIDDIIAGLNKNVKFVKIVERKQAVHESLSDLQEGEILLLAGKGHEDYIILGTNKISYSDIEEVEKFAEKSKGQS